ncbi:glycosyltransferase family 4 protein [Halapricum salinum]|uniref:Glycosyltransferase family 1 protein n=1 Tax=Halapricum salinum TaxID=1457250 RepID=A0A4D6H9J6_9EURY|nr:glycosyltransferase family 4 protein [Halapricum salinum]QCC49876.1 glycosyltransferase family 1 protein [Halapricum salinum]
MPPTVLMLGWGYPPNVTGGLDTAIYELIEAFKLRDDFEIELVLPAEFAPEDEPNIYGVETDDGDFITRVNAMVDTFRERAGDADIVHTNDWFGYKPGSEAKEAHDVPWVTCFHSLSAERNRDPPPVELEAERNIVEEADHLLTVSEITRDRIREQFGGDPQVIYNGFPTLEPTGRDLKVELGIDDTMVLFVGRHTHQKGIDHLLAAIERLSREDLTLVVGGSGHLTDQLERFAELLDIEEQVRFVGYVPEEELADYYASADLFVSPAVAEPFGLAVVEALSVDTRVVTTECGAAEILPDNCLVAVDPASRSIARGINRALAMDDPIEYEMRGWDQVAAEHAAFYSEILD